jgi:hypothetical protein
MDKPNLKNILHWTACAALPLAVTFASVPAWAQEPSGTQPTETGDQTTTTDAEKNAIPENEAPNDGDLPVPKSDDDPKPEVAGPAVPPGGIVKQAGVGGVTGYGRSGVLELGGSAGFRVATDLTQVNVSPSIGWFLADNFQLSAILDLAYVSTGDEDVTTVSALVEPSYHLPFSRSVFGFFGFGLGIAYIDQADLGAGFALAPRLGVNMLVGRSGVLTPFVSWQYTTHDTAEMTNTTLVAVSSAFRFNVGYTVMW